MGSFSGEATGLRTIPDKPYLTWRDIKQMINEMDEEQLSQEVMVQHPDAQETEFFQAGVAIHRAEEDNLDDEEAEDDGDLDDLDDLEEGDRLENNQVYITFNNW